ncbi:MAG: hypothetical protein E7261_05280 [Lachnospiraceae bacterium]|nr:hypothetical protein [Lachnospiraceae bacterium]
MNAAKNHRNAHKKYIITGNTIDASSVKNAPDFFAVKEAKKDAFLFIFEDMNINMRFFLSKGGTWRVFLSSEFFCVLAFCL